MENQASQNAGKPFVAINAQYIKDMSFENPEAPESFTKINSAPKIDLSLDVNVKKMNDDNFEVSIKITSKASHEKTTLFVAELSYAGVFTVKDCTDENQKEQILLIYCPSLIFPFARRIIADMTRDGGYQPLMINPVDFAVLYMQQKQSAEKRN
jgi:preprotein translocase subunit SecB